MWTQLKAVITEIIRTNNDQEITGQLLQNTLISIVNNLGEKATLSGVAEPTTTPGLSDGPTCYLASVGGTYSNFDNIEISDNEIALLIWDGVSWTKQTMLHLEDYQDLVDLRDGAPLIGFDVVENADGSKTLRTKNWSTKTFAQAYKLNVATTSASGLMSADDKKELAKKANTETVNAELKKKVNFDDNAPQLTAGFASNLVGRGDALDSTIGFRATAGIDSITDGAANIKKLKGNTIAWNQLAKNPNFSNGVADWSFGGGVESHSINSDGSLRLYYKGGVYNQDIRQSSTGIPVGHKVLMTMACHVSGSTKKIGFMLNGQAVDLDVSASNVYNHILEVRDETYSVFRFCVVSSSDATPEYVDVYSATITDLTRMFGAGNEPTTIEEFNARKPLNVNDDYNRGELLSTNVEALKTVGFNAWDEQWEVGGLSNGQPSNTNNQIRSKNFARCLPETQYHGTILNATGEDTLHIAWYDKNKRHITNVNCTNRTVTSPKSAAYFKIQTKHADAYGNAYKNDICINLSHSGYRDGEYEAYKQYVRPIDIASIEKIDGTPLFPYGLCSAGSVYDEITATKAIKRIGAVDLGTLSWTTLTTSTIDDGRPNIRMSADMSGIKRAETSATLGNLLCSEYVSRSADDIYLKKRGISVERVGYRALSLYDPDYTDPTEFKTAMQGVMLFYELETPIEVTFNELINLDYQVSDFGTEEAVGENSAPLRADIVYQFNAVDKLRALKVEQIPLATVSNDGLMSKETVKLLGNFVDLGLVSTSSVAENMAFELAGNSSIIFMRYETSNGQIGFIRQHYMNTGQTHQYLTLNDSEYVRVVSYDAGIKSPWRSIPKASLVYKLMYNQGSRLLSFHDPIQDEAFGGITLPEATTGNAGLMTATQVTNLNNAVKTTGAQTISGEKTFNDNVKIASKTVIAKNIDPGELKVLHNNSNKGFIVRTKNTSDSILPLEMLTTNGASSYQYNFPAKSGTVALLSDLEALQAQITTLTQQLTALTQN